MTDENTPHSIRAADQEIPPSEDSVPDVHGVTPPRLIRLRQLGIVTILAAAAITVILIATGASSSAPPRPGSPQALTIERKITGLLTGIPENANVLGRSTAPVTLQWFGDLECPYCKAFTLEALPIIIPRWVRTGEMKIEYRSMKTATHPLQVFKTQQVAALAAGMQNKMWPYIETFYHEQSEENSGYVTNRYLQNLARQIPALNLELWADDRYNPLLTSQVEADMQAAKHEGFPGTPSFLIGRTGHKLKRLEPNSLSSLISTTEHLLRE
jgi:protein-disulfide isomerase